MEKSPVLTMWRKIALVCFITSLLCCSVVNPNTLNLDPDPEICPNVDSDLDPSRFTHILYQLWKQLVEFSFFETTYFFDLEKGFALQFLK